MSTKLNYLTWLPVILRQKLIGITFYQCRRVQFLNLFDCQNDIKVMILTWNHPRLIEIII